jgi:multicomponent Na+:H+ antiporter subunit D
VLAAFAFIVVGLGLKLALFPLHIWLPNAYAYAPSVVTALLAGTATKVAVYLLLRFVFTLFGPTFAFAGEPLAMLLMALALVAILSTSVSAIFQQDAKRLLAYSSIAQIGYIVLGVSLLSLAGMTAGIVHLFNHALTKAALFLALGAVFYRIGSARLDDLAGIGRQMPLTMFAFVIAGFSLIGVPLTVGFVSKWTLISALFAKGLWPLAVLVLLGSLLAVIYIWRVVEAAYFRPRPAGAEAVSEAPLGMLLPLWLLVAASVYFGLDTSLTLGTAERAAALLLGALG